MELSGRYRIGADRQTVWRGLNDPETLKASIPGCEALEQVGEEGFAATVRAKLGPVSATFNGTVTLEDVNPPESYRLVGEGKGGVAGFGKGSAAVRLDEDGPQSTILTYDGQAQIGGKLAQIGSRLIAGSVRKLTAQFFTNLAANLGVEAEELPAQDSAAEDGEGAA